ncbi:unnamed protein product, partial [Ectocarpus fasciculatus]
MASTDREALIALFRSTGGTGWRRRDNWDTDAELATWFGVTEVNDQGRVVRLDLATNNLQDPIPPELGNLRELKTLWLSHNQLSGPIHKELGALTKLTSLILRHNKLTGFIPPELGDLGALETLDLGINRLTGPIPKELGSLTQLKELFLHLNRLTGPIPPELGALRELHTLSFSYNQFTGRVPPELGNLGALKTLNLRANQLTGLIPPGLGRLALLTTLDLEGNPLTGPIPRELKKHCNFRRFDIPGLALDGAPLPEVDHEDHAMEIVIVPVLLGYFDLGSDLYTAWSYYESGHPIWFGLGLLFALGPAVVVSVFFLSDCEWYRRVLVATQLSLLWEAWETVQEAKYSELLALVRVIEPLFESVPQLMLQLYALLVLWIETSSGSHLVSRVVSVCISATSLAYCATDVCSVDSLLSLLRKGGFGGDIYSRCPSLTEKVFSRVPDEVGAFTLKGLGNVHSHSHVWLCFVYHVLEIFSRFVSLSMLALVLREWFFLVLPYLWGSRCFIVWMAALKSQDDGGWDAARKTLRSFRFRVRLVAMPFLDSVMDGSVAFASGLALTLVEFIACLALYRSYENDDLTSSVRLVLTVVAVGCMVGKMCLALVAIFPLKKDQDDSAVQGGAVGEGGDGA